MSIIKKIKFLVFLAAKSSAGNVFKADIFCAKRAALFVADNLVLAVDDGYAHFDSLDCHQTRNPPMARVDSKKPKGGTIALIQGLPFPIT